MISESGLIVTDFAVVMTIAAVVALLFHRLRLPLVPGYILAGIVLSAISGVFSLVRSLDSIDVMSQLGMVLLLFTIGLQFSLPRLRACGMLAIVIGCIEITMVLTGGYWFGLLLGWSPVEALALGGVLSISSTVMVFRRLADQKELRTTYGHLMIGILIVEDAAAVLLITYFSAQSGPGIPGLADTALIVAKIVIFMVTALAIGIYVAPRFIDRLAAQGSSEILTVTLLGLCFGMAAFAGVLGFSPSIGAFVMGVIAGESAHARRIERRLRSMRDFFVALFFITIGFFIPPEGLWEALPMGLVLAGVFMALNFMSGTFASVLVGRHRVTAVRVGVGLLAMGEFSFVIALTAVENGLVGQELLAMTVIASLVTSALMPLLVRRTDVLLRRRAGGEESELQLYACLTADWADRLGGLLKVRGGFARETRRFIRRMIVSMFIVALMLLLAGGMLPRLEELSSLTGASVPDLHTALFAITVSVLLVQAVIMARLIKEYVERLSNRIIDTSEAAEALGRKVVRRVLANATGIILSLILLFVLSFFLTAFGVQWTVTGILAVGLLVAVSWLMADSLRRIHERVDSVFSSSLTGKGRRNRGASAIRRELSEGQTLPPPRPRTEE